jgi:hypothetical protein
MPYVMVPVPEEHVEDVMQFILGAIARASVEPWTADSVAELFDDVDEASRSLLAFVARATLDGSDLPEADAARKLQLTMRESAGIMNELKARTGGASRPSLISANVVAERLPNGRTKDVRVLRMDPDVAALVRAAEEAELASAPDPVASGPR